MIHAFSGGVGGARLSRGLADELMGTDLTIVVNTGDDFDYLGLRIMPDFDSVVYGIAGCNDADRGWGRAGETWQCKGALAELGVDTWFSLGDKDLAMHLLRLSLLKAGATFTEVATEIVRRMGIGCRVLPMTDHPVETIIVSDRGELSFQDYFVRMRCEPRVTAFRLAGGTVPLEPVRQHWAHSRLAWSRGCIAAGCRTGDRRQPRHRGRLRERPAGENAARAGQADHAALDLRPLRRSARWVRAGCARRSFCAAVT